MKSAAVLSQAALRKRINAALQGGTIAAVDIGESKIACLAARVDPGRLAANVSSRDRDIYGAMRITGAGRVRSRGVKNGVILDPEAVGEAIRAAAEAAGAKAVRTMFSIAGGAPRLLSIRAESHVPLGEIDTEAIARLLSACRQELAPRLRIPVQAIPTDFHVDGEWGHRDPRGEPARSIGAEMQTLTMDRAAIEPLAQAAKHAGLSVAAVFPSPAAAALASLTEDELQLGATCLDMGAGGTGAAGYARGRLSFISSVPLGGARLTADLAQAMGVDTAEAERLKISGGAAVAADPSVLGGAGPGEATMLMIGVARPRVEEIFELAREAIPEGDLRPVILTGGASRLPGVVEAARTSFARRARLGRPIRIAGAPAFASGPEFSAAHGLLVHALRSASDPFGAAIDSAIVERRQTGGLSGWLRRNW